MYGIFGKFQARPGERDTLIDLLLTAADELRTLDGCYHYVISRDLADPNGVWVNEVWRSQDDHQASLALETVQALIATARPLIAGMGERFEVEPVGGKGL